MHFLNSAFLWGLPLAAMPVVIHLLNRRRQRVIQWGAMQFLLEILRQQRRIWRWRDWLLMCLRVAAVLGLVLAVAQPMVQSSWFGSSTERDIILILDTSMSTARAAGNGQGTRFDALLAQADRMLDGLSAGERIRVLLASTPPQWLLPLPTQVTPEMRSELKGRLQQLHPTLASADMLRSVQEALAAEPAAGAQTRIIALLTDDQAYGWRIGEGLAWRQMKQKLDPGVAVNVFNVQGGNGFDNLSIDSVSASRSVAAPAETLTFTAAIKNTGTTAAPATGASWSSGNGTIGLSAIPPLKPGEVTSVRISHAIDRAGVQAVTCRIDRPDDLAPDNSDRVIVECVAAQPILVIDAGTGSVSEPGGEARRFDDRASPPPAMAKMATVPFFLAALGRGLENEEGGWQSVFQPIVVAAAKAEEQQLDDFGVIVISDLPRLSPALVARLKEHVRHGGGLWLALGEPSEPAAIRELVTAGLIPLEIETAAGDAADHEHYLRIRPPAQNHAATALLADTQRLDLDHARIYRRYPFKPGPPDVSVLISTDDGAALAVEKRLERGRIIVQGFPLGAGWSNLPLCQAYVVMVHEWLWYLAEPGLTHWNLRPGEALMTTFPRDAVGAAMVTDPTGNRRRVTTEITGERARLMFRETTCPGEYQLATERPDERGEAGDAAAAAIPFHVQRDPLESDLASLKPADVQALEVASGLRFVSDALTAPAGRNLTAASRPVWSYLLASLLGLFLVELLFAGMLSRRRVTGTPGLTMGTTGHSPSSSLGSRPESVVEAQVTN